jgi:hypothetical protein
MKQLLIITVIALLAPMSPASSPSEEPIELPERFTAMLQMTKSAIGPAGMARVAVVVESWTTDEERGSLLAALEEGGSDGLVKAMQELDVGYVQIGMSLGWRLRTAATWNTVEGRKVRVVTDRPLHFQEQYRGTQSADYPVGVIEFLLPPDGDGEGALLAATKVQFDEQGRIEVTSLPSNIGAQKLTLVQKEVRKKKKKKKKSK